jgi:hypothetical protein
MTHDGFPSKLTICGNAPSLARESIEVEDVSAVVAVVRGWVGG